MPLSRLVLILGTMVMAATKAGRPVHGYDVPGPACGLASAGQNMVVALRLAEGVGTSPQAWSGPRLWRISSITAATAGRRVSKLRWVLPLLTVIRHRLGGFRR